MNILKILDGVNNLVDGIAPDVEISEVYDILLNSIQQGEGYSTKDELYEAMDKFEILERTLEIPNTSERLKFYTAGMTKMMVQYSLDMIRFQEEIVKIVQLKRKYKYLEKILIFLENHPYATQKKIAVELNIGKRTLNNFLKKIKSLDFILSHKIEKNITLYTLTSKGSEASKMIQSKFIQIH